MFGSFRIRRVTRKKKKYKVSKSLEKIWLLAVTSGEIEVARYIEELKKQRLEE